MCCVTCPYHQGRLGFCNGAEDVIAAAEYLVGRLEALFDHVMSPADSDFEVGGWGAIVVIVRRVKSGRVRDQFTIEFDAINVAQTRFYQIKRGDGGVP